MTTGDAGPRNAIFRHRWRVGCRRPRTANTPSDRVIRQMALQMPSPTDGQHAQRSCNPLDGADGRSVDVRALKFTARDPVGAVARAADQTRRLRARPKPPTTTAGHYGILTYDTTGKRVFSKKITPAQASLINRAGMISGNEPGI